MTLSFTQAVLLLFVVLGVVWPFCTMRDKTSPARGHGAGSQGDGTGAPDRPGACRPEFYEPCAIGSDGKCTRWSHYHHPEVKS